MGQHRLGSEPTGEQRLPDSFAGHRISDRGSIADEHRAGSDQRDAADPRRDRPSLVWRLSNRVRSQRPSDVRSAEEIEPQLLHLADAVPSIAAYSEPDVRTTSSQRKGPRVSRQEVGLEPDDQIPRGPIADVAPVLTERMPLTEVVVDGQAQRLANRRPHAVRGDQVHGPNASALPVLVVYVKVDGVG